MKTLLTELTQSVAPVRTYDKTKTSIFGNTIAVKPLNGVSCIGPMQTQFIDVFIDSGAFPADIYYTNNNTLYIISAPLAGGTSIMRYNQDPTTGKFMYQGRFLFTLPNSAATTYGLKGFVVDDSTSSISIYVTVTGSVLTNGGTYKIHRVSATDFVTVGFKTVYQAISSDINAVYALTSNAEIGASNLQTSPVGSCWAEGDVTFGTKLYVHNGVAATHQFYQYDMTQTPNIVTLANTSVNVNSGTTTFAQTSNPYNNGDQLVVIANNPTGLNLTTQNAVQSVYFIVNRTATTFQLSLTSGGAAILCTSITTPTFCRAFGQTVDLFGFKTGNLPSLLNLQTTNSEKFAIPSNGVLSGEKCIFIPGTTALYMGKLSDLSSGVTTWASLITSNILGNGLDIVTPTNIISTYSNDCDTAFMVPIATSGIIVAKQLVNSIILKAFGGTSNQFLEAQNIPVVPFKSTSITSLQSRNGLLFEINTIIVGQRGIFVVDASADDYFKSNSSGAYIITKTLPTKNITLRGVSLWEQLRQYSSRSIIYYRTATSASDTIFNSPTGSWVQLSMGTDLSAITLNSFTQFRITFSTLDYGSMSPAQISELLIDYSSADEISNNWVASPENGSRANISPVLFAWRMAKTYTSTVPRLKVMITDDAGGLRIYDTVTNSSQFTHTVNNGTSWVALGTIPNTALTTEVRFQDPSPSGLPTTVTLQEY